MKRMIYVVLALAAPLAVAGFWLSASGQDMQANGGKGSAQQATKMLIANAGVKTEAPATPIASVQGPSWLKHLGLTVSQTRMGQMGGNSLPVTSGKPETATGDSARPALQSVMHRFLATLRSDSEQAAGILNEKFTVTGSDLYRWNCQSCHGPDGKGAEPEINSVLGPVQGTSAVLTKKRMEARGIDADDEVINQVTELAEASLRDRLQHGGKSMPSFEYLRTDEVDALIGHLEKLAGVPPTKRNGLAVHESASRVGEHIVRGTCHVCHDATGPGSEMMHGSGMMHGTIPSLASISNGRSLSGVVHQVQYGSSGMMRMMGRDAMPPYPYFTEEEIAAIYFSEYAARR